MSWRQAIGLIPLLGACAYGGAFEGFAGAFPPARASLACVDIGVGEHTTSRRGAPALELAFGNRCDHRVELDLGTLRAYGRTGSGERVGLALVGESQRLGIVTFAARWQAREVLELELYDGSNRLLLEVCVDVGSLQRESSPGELWLCTAPVTRGAS